MSKIAAVGMFDGVHRGHRHLWQQIRSRCDASGASSLAVTFNRHPLELIAPERAPRLLCTVDERIDLLQQAGAEEVLLLDFNPELRSLSGKEFVAMLKSRHDVSDLVMGFNHSIGSDRVATADAYAEISAATGVKLHPESEYCCDDGCKVSSSAIRYALSEGNVTLATQLLGRPYSLSGKVAHGKQLGRTIGFPTANIEEIDPQLLIPPSGVYALDVQLPDGSIHRAMANIGCRPTVDHSHNAPETVEVNIFGFSGNLYGDKLTLHFLKRLRDEQRFASVEELRSQLHADRLAAQAL